MEKETFTILGKKDCPFCDMAVSLLRSKGYWFQYHCLSEKPWLKFLVAQAGHKKVPLIFLESGFLLGGYSDLVEYLGD